MSFVKDIIRRAVPLDTKRTLMRMALSEGLTVAVAGLVEDGVTFGGVIDVGAYHGEWTKTVSRLLPGVPFLMIEALPNKMGCLNRVARQTHRAAVEIALLSNEAGKEVTFYERETGSSMYQENTDTAYKTTKRWTDTLDQVMPCHPQLVPVYFLKLDVQGAELDVLAGGLQTLKDCAFVQLEVAIEEYNKGAPGFDEVTAFMRDAGFVIYDVVNHLRSPKHKLLQLDILFARTASSFRQTAPVRDINVPADGYDARFETY